MAGGIAPPSAASPQGARRRRGSATPREARESAGNVTPELTHVLSVLAETFAGLGREAGPSAVDTEREAMRRLRRD